MTASTSVPTLQQELVAAGLLSPSTVRPGVWDNASANAYVRVVAEIVGWQGHPLEQVQQMKAHLDQLKAQGLDHIID